MARPPRAFFSPIARFALMSSVAALGFDDAWAEARARMSAGIDTSGFRDAPHHWRKINEPERVMQPEITAAVDGAVAWLQGVALKGIRVERVPAPPVEYFRHKTDFDVVVVKDEQAPALWARTYEVGTDRPIFASRDGIKVYSLAEVDRERRTGSGWYGNWPRALIETEYPQWRGAAHGR